MNMKYNDGKLEEFLHDLYKENSKLSASTCSNVCVIFSMMTWFFFWTCSTHEVAKILALSAILFTMSLFLYLYSFFAAEDEINAFMAHRMALAVKKNKINLFLTKLVFWLNVSAGILLVTAAIVFLLK